MRLSVCGLHLSGVGSKKSAMVRGSVTLNKETQDTPHFIWEAYSHEIGSQKGLFSDEKIIKSLKNLGDLNVIVIDAPLSLPPCMTCALPCPGIAACEIDEVSFMKNLLKSEQRDSHRAQVKPYLDRAFETSLRSQVKKSVMQAEPNEFSPVLGSNRAPLTARAVQILNLLVAEFPQAMIVETNSVLSAWGWAKKAGLKVPRDTHFKHGLDSRLLRIKLLKQLEQNKIATRSPTLHLDIFKEFYNMKEVFSAAMSALTGWGFLVGQTFVDKNLIKHIKSPHKYKQVIFPPQLPADLFEG